MQVKILKWKITCRFQRFQILNSDFKKHFSKSLFKPNQNIVSKGKKTETKIVKFSLIK